MEAIENNNPVSVEVSIQKTVKILYFGDGVQEVMEEEAVPVTESSPDSHPVLTVDPQTLTWGPWFSHYAVQSASKLLNAVDYAGETLADFFGITTPKYQIEINEHERLQAEKKKMEEESWVPKHSGGDVPLVLNEPVKDVKKMEEA